MSGKREAFEKDWNAYMSDKICSDDCLNAFEGAWRIQQARINKLEAALKEIANIDYRGNRSTASQIAFKAINKEPV